MADAKLAPGQFLVDVRVSSKQGPRKITVIADADQGFTIDDCAELSRYLSKVLDERNLIDDNYFLEVTTPGTDYPLKTKRQYLKNIGRTLKVKLADRTLEGKLTGVTDEGITLTYETASGKKKNVETTELPLTAIEKAFVMISFK